MIEAERQRLDVARFLKHIATKIGEREAARCSISVAELAHGVHRAKHPDSQKRYITIVKLMWRSMIMKAKP